MEKHIIAIFLMIGIIFTYALTLWLLKKFLDWTRERSGYYEKPPRPKPTTVNCIRCNKILTDFEYFVNPELCSKCVRDLKQYSNELMNTLCEHCGKSFYWREDCPICDTEKISDNVAH